MNMQDLKYQCEQDKMVWATYTIEQDNVFLFAWQKYNVHNEKSEYLY